MMRNVSLKAIISQACVVCTFACVASNVAARPSSEEQMFSLSTGAKMRQVLMILVSVMLMWKFSLNLH